MGKSEMCMNKSKVCRNGKARARDFRHAESLCDGQSGMSSDLHAVIRDCYYTHVGFNRAERVVGRLCFPVLTQSIEHRGLQPCKQKFQTSARTYRPGFLPSEVGEGCFKMQIPYALVSQSHSIASQTTGFTKENVSVGGSQR